MSPPRAFAGLAGRHVVGSGAAALVALLVAITAAGCGDPNGPPRRAGATAPAAASDGGAPERARASLSGSTAVTAAGPEPGREAAPARPFAELATAPLERVVMTLRADPDATARRHAADVYVQRLAQGASPEPLLEACAADLDPVVRRWAALGLAAAPAPALAPRLAALAASEPDPTVRSILARAAREAERKEAPR